MKLYKLKQSDYYTFFGTSKEKGGELIERDVTRVAQTPSCDAFLYLSNTTYDQLELLDTAPTEGFDFTYCQEWGLEVTQAKIDRVIAEISA
tara:strand:+ start:47 stop:319 length:273 start_codon:yes stop_codon:yes gene_type:complete